MARRNLDQLRLDYEDFLRQRGLEQWPPEHPVLVRFKSKQCATLVDVRPWVEQERKQARTSVDNQGTTRTLSPQTTSVSVCESIEFEG
jgi:hypothetical protein